MIHYQSCEQLLIFCKRMYSGKKGTMFCGMQITEKPDNCHLTDHFICPIKTELFFRYI